jgi:rod shape-determining protein MreD
MRDTYIYLFIILAINIATFTLLTIINSEICRYGIFLYLPGLFFFNSCIYLNQVPGIIVCIITGLYLDVIYTTPFGLHALLLALSYLIGRNWTKKNTNTKPWRFVLFQCLFNFLLIIICFVILKSRDDLGFNWSVSRFLIDLIISSSVIIPLAFWKIEINRIIIDNLPKRFLKNTEIHEIE